MERLKTKIAGNLHLTGVKHINLDYSSDNGFNLLGSFFRSLLDQAKFVNSSTFQNVDFERKPVVVERS